MTFSRWLDQQKGDGDASELGSVAGEEHAGSSSDSGSSFSEAGPSAASPSSSSRAGPSVALPHRQMVRPTLALDCRMETRLADTAACMRQEMTIVLATPGLSMHNAPVVAAKQVRLP